MSCILIWCMEVALSIRLYYFLTYKLCLCIVCVDTDRDVTHMNDLSIPSPWRLTGNVICLLQWCIIHTNDTRYGFYEFILCQSLYTSLFSHIMHKRHISCQQFLGMFIKLQKVTVSFVISVHLSALNNSPPTDIFWKSSQKIQVLLKSDKLNRQFAWRHWYIYCTVSLSSS